MAVGFGSVWVTSQATGSVTRIDLRSRAVVATRETGSGAGAVAVGHGGVWVANSLDGTVTRVDPAGNAVAATIPVGDGPNGVAVTPDAVWASNELGGTLTKIDALRNVPAATVTTGNRPEGIVTASGSLFVAVRASGAGHRGGTLTVLLPGADVVSLDPALANDPETGQLVVLTNDGLTGFRKVGGRAGLQLVPDLAVSLPAATDGGRSYTFQLRPDIHYSTGALVRPEDFRWAFERSLRLVGSWWELNVIGARSCAAAPDEPCDLSRGIETAVGSNTLTFHLTAPDPDFLYRLAQTPAYAVPVGTPLHPQGFVAATGPYRVASFDPETGARLVRNPQFREWSAAAQPNGFPDTIVERFQGSPDEHVTAVLGGSADLAIDLSVAKPSTTVLAAARRQHPSQLEQSPWITTWLLAMNTHAPPFDDVRVRRALNFAVDRNRLRNLTLGQDLGSLTCQVLPPQLDGYRRSCPYTAEPSASGIWTGPDVKRARRLVRASGTAGQTVTFWIPRWIHFGAAAGKYVVSVLDSLGYDAHFRFAADPYASEDRLHVQVGFFGWGPDFATPSGFIPPGFSCSSYNRVNSLNENVAEFCDPAIDREIARAQALQTSDQQASSRLWTKIDRDLTEQAPWVPYANGVVVEVKSARVRNYQYSPQWGTLLDQLGEVKPSPARSRRVVRSALDASA